jgi:cellobiose PTS system EIIB component
MYLKKGRRSKMKIVLCCAGGFSTTMLMESMKGVIKKSAKLKEDDFKFAAIPVDILESEVEDCDVVVVGPQIAHKLDYIKSIIDPHEIPYVVVDKETYGKMDGATVLKKVLIERKKADMKKNK